MSARTATVLLLLTVLPAPGSPVAAQEVWAGAGFESFAFGEGDLVGADGTTLFTTPFGIRMPVGGVAFVDVRGSVARAVLTNVDGTSVTRSGLVDTAVRVAVALGSVEVSGLALLPTGSPAESVGQAALTGLLSHELLGFGLPWWGTAGGFGGDVALNLTLEGSRVRVGGGYQISGEIDGFEPQSAPYVPGAQLRGEALFETPLGSDGWLSGSVLHQRFTDDEYLGSPNFRPASRTLGVVAWSSPVGARESMLIRGAVELRGEGIPAARIASRSAPPRDEPLWAGTTPGPGRRALSGGAAFHLVRGGLRVTPEGELRVFSSPDGRGQGWLGVVGVSADFDLPAGGSGRALRVAPWVRGSLGSVVAADDARSALTGFGAGLVASFDVAMARRTSR